jgi:hypothetical protein
MLKRLGRMLASVFRRTMEARPSRLGILEAVWVLRQPVRNLALSKLPSLQRSKA